jgi:hypothetical protein
MTPPTVKKSYLFKKKNTYKNNKKHLIIDYSEVDDADGHEDRCPKRHHCSSKASVKQQ